MKKLISIILTFALSFSTIYYAHCFDYKPTTAQSKIINAKISSLNETRNAVDKVYGSIPRKTSLFKKFLAVTLALGSAALVTFAAFKKNITNLWNSSVYNDNSPPFNPDTKESSDTSDSNNSNWWLKSLPYVFDILILSVAAYFLLTLNKLDNPASLY